MNFDHPYLIALGVLLLLWILYSILTQKLNPLAVVFGADGRPSTSKLQFWMWTVVALFSYVALYAARVNNGYVDPINDLPRNLLLAMGFSIVTATAAKGITVSQLQSGNVVKTPATPETSGAGQVLKDDSGALDLSKIQMLAWTVVAIGVYLVHVFNVVGGVNKNNPGSMPDIDAALIVLMGLGQGAYLGKKLVTTDIPGVTGLVPSSGKVGTEVTVRGTSFGAAQGGSLITLDDQSSAADVTLWADNQIKFKFPDKQPDGSDWPAAGKQVIVGVTVGGLDSATAAPFTVTT